MFENYVNARIPPKHRSAIAKCRCGVAQLRLETGRYENVPDLRECLICKNGIENEIRVLFHCNACTSLTTELYPNDCDINVGFNVIRRN